MKITAKEDQVGNILQMDDFKNRLKPAGEGPKQDNWLKELALGAIFLAKPKASTTFVVNEFCRGSDLDEEIILLVEYSATGQPVQYFVDSALFSKTMRLIKVREIPNEGSVS